MDLPWTLSWVEHWAESNIYYLDSMVFVPFCILMYLNIIFLFLNQNRCCGYSKDQSLWDGSLPKTHD